MFYGAKLRKGNSFIVEFNISLEIEWCIKEF